MHDEAKLAKSVHLFIELKQLKKSQMRLYVVEFDPDRVIF